MHTYDYYIHIYKGVFIRTCIHVYVYIYMYLHMYAFTHVRIYIYNIIYNIMYKLAFWVPMYLVHHPSTGPAQAVQVGGRSPRKPAP